MLQQSLAGILILVLGALPWPSRAANFGFCDEVKTKLSLCGSTSHFTDKGANCSNQDPLGTLFPSSTQTIAGLCDLESKANQQTTSEFMAELKRLQLVSAGMYVQEHLARGFMAGLGNLLQTSTIKSKLQEAAKRCQGVKKGNSSQFDLLTAQLNSIDPKLGDEKKQRALAREVQSRTIIAHLETDRFTKCLDKATPAQKEFFREEINKLRVTYPTTNLPDQQSQSFTDNLSSLYGSYEYQPLPLNCEPMSPETREILFNSKPVSEIEDPPTHFRPHNSRTSNDTTPLYRWLMKKPEFYPGVRVQLEALFKQTVAGSIEAMAQVCEQNLCELGQNNERATSRLLDRDPFKAQRTSIAAELCRCPVTAPVKVVGDENYKNTIVYGAAAAGVMTLSAFGCVALPLSCPIAATTITEAAIGVGWGVTTLSAARTVQEGYNWAEASQRANDSDYQRLTRDDQSVADRNQEQVDEARGNTLNSGADFAMTAAGTGLTKAFERAKIRYAVPTSEKSATHLLPSVDDTTSLLRSSDEAEVAAVRLRQSSNRDLFVEKLGDYNPTTPRENRYFMNLMESKSLNRNIVFIDRENAMMKTLNDTILNKPLVTAMTNYDKLAMLKEINELKKRNPGLVVVTYSDAKSLRFAFTGKVPPNIRKQYQEAAERVNAKTAEVIRELRLIRPTDPDPKTWFLSGSGRTPTEANNAARFAREAKDKSKVHDWSDAELQANRAQTLETTEALRGQIAQKFQNTPVVTAIDADKQTLSIEAFDLVRKYPDNNDLRRAFSSRFEVDNLSDKDIDNMRNYLRNVDRFSPPVFVEKREIVNLDEAEFGAHSMDMKGMGASNFYATAASLSKASHPTQALELAQQGEREVTKIFNQRKQELMKAYEQHPMTTNFTGDDGAAILKANKAKDAIASLRDTLMTKIRQEQPKAPPAVIEERYDEITQKIVENLPGKGIRMAFVRPGVASKTARNEISSHGEDIEKKFIKTLDLSGSRLPQGFQQNTSFFVDMRTTQVNEGPVRLYFNPPPGMELTEAQRAYIQAKFREAVERFNMDDKNPALILHKYRAD